MLFGYQCLSTNVVHTFKMINVVLLVIFDLPQLMMGMVIVVIVVVMTKIITMLLVSHFS